MATKNCPKCDSPNPVACKKCACGHVFFTTRRSANALAAESAEDISEPTTPQEPELPRRRTARVTRERPQFYDALQVENQTRRQKELQKRRKASKSDEAEGTGEDVPEKVVVTPSTSKRRAESPPAKAAEPTPKKRRGRPPGLTNRRSGRAQILASKPNESSSKMEVDGSIEGEMEAVAGMHEIPPLKALQMNLVLGDINARISSSSVRAEIGACDSTTDDLPEETKAADVESKQNDEKKEGRGKRKSGTQKVEAEEKPRAVKVTRASAREIEEKKEEGEKILTPSKIKKELESEPAENAEEGIKKEALEKRSPGKMEKESPGKLEKDSPGKLEKDSPGKLEKDSPGKLEEDSPGKLEKDSPGELGKDSPGKLEKDSPGKLQKDSPGKVEKEQSLTTVKKELSKEEAKEEVAPEPHIIENSMPAKVEVDVKPEGEMRRVDNDSKEKGETSETSTVMASASSSQGCAFPY